MAQSPRPPPLIDVVEDLLTLSALESSPPPPMDDPVAMKPLLERLGAEARALSGGRHRIELEAEEGLDLVGSEKELASAFGNLVSNAIKYSPDGGRIEIVVASDATSGIVEVRDQGIGIASDALEDVFAPFRRRAPEVATGAGLGLSVVRRLVEAHEGTIEVESELGRGSTFRVRLPLSRAPETG